LSTFGFGEGSSLGLGDDILTRFLLGFDGEVGKVEFVVLRSGE
jgi:hypothetical protein